MILRAFGSRLGKGIVYKPRLNIKYPWFLEIGDHSWIGEGVWIDNLCQVKIGRNVCVSQGVSILTGSHDWKRSSFPFFSQPVTVGDGVWITAFRVIRPGTNIPESVAVLDDLSPSSLRLWRATQQSCE